MPTKTTDVSIQFNDELLAAALWYKHLKEKSNEAFLPLYFDKHRFLVLKGGGGSGKSIFAGDKILERSTTETGHRFLICRKVGKTLRDSCFNQLVGQLKDMNPDVKYKVNKGDMRITFENGNEIIFSGLDDVEKLKSIYNITGIWIEEASELKESDFNQLNIRLRGKTQNYKQIIITFNPISITHWLKRRFFDCTDLPAKERAKIRTHESTYKDNRFLDREAIEVLEAFKYTDEYYYQVYCLGLWGVTGKSVFNAKALTERLLLNIQPKMRGMFDVSLTKADLITKYHFTSDDNGYIAVYKPPEHNVPYVIGADTAGDGSDYFVAMVLDNRTGEQVAVMRHQTDEDLFAKQLYCLGMWYNTALIAVETNYSTFPAKELERQRYPKQYIREQVDTYTGKVKHSWGFQTNTKTRPLIIAELVKAVRDDVTVVIDKTTIEEMLTFVRDESFRPEAEQGAHDDCVMALAIAHHIRPRHSSIAAEDENTISAEWSESMYEDWRKASSAEKKYLESKWGKPPKRKIKNG